MNGRENHMARRAESVWRAAIAAAGIGLALAAGMLSPGLAAAAGPVPDGFREPRPGLYTGGVPDADRLAAFKALGVGTVIDLRTPEERARNDTRSPSEALGLRYETLAIAGAQDLTPENAERLRHLLDEADGKVLLHCGSGNRVGALLALMSYYDEGASRRAALQFGRDAGMVSLEPEVERRLRAGRRSR